MDQTGDRVVTNYSQQPNQTPIIRDLGSVVPQLTNVEDIIGWLEHDFRGESWSIDPQIGGKWVKLGDRVMNDKGIKNVCSLVHPYVNKVVLTSNFDAEAVGPHIFDMCCSLREHLATHYEEYEIKISDLEIITIKVRSLAYAAWRSSVDEGMRKTMFGGISEHYISSTQTGTRGLLGGKLINGIL